MSIDPEKLLDLAKRRHHDAGVTLGWPTVMKIVEGLRERDVMAALAAERAQFILNAVEFGYCQLPESDTPDSAHGTYERCKLKDDKAFTCWDAAMKAEALHDLLMYPRNTAGALRKHAVEKRNEYRRQAGEVIE